MSISLCIRRKTHALEITTTFQLHHESDTSTTQNIRLVDFINNLRFCLPYATTTTLIYKVSHPLFLISLYQSYLSLLFYN